jgi:hypothetical protein
LARRLVFFFIFNFFATFFEPLRDLRFFPTTVLDMRLLPTREWFTNARQFRQQIALLSKQAIRMVGRVNTST